MRIKRALLILALLALPACGGADSGNQQVASQRPASGQRGMSANTSAAQQAPASTVAQVSATGETVALDQATSARMAAEAINRKIIRNGELALETQAPIEAQQRITSIAEAHGGFVVTSDFRQNPSGSESRPGQTLTVVARVPATQFSSALEQIRAVGERVIQEKVTGQDVTEEYLDLEARIRTQKALEAQFLEIMKQARKVEEALNVQRELASVRTDIERLEGRHRFLDNQASLSTITVTLATPAPIVTATTAGFGDSVKQAFGNSVDVAAAIILGFIRLVIVLVPVALLLGIPAWIIYRFVRRRVAWEKKPASIVETEP
jgi:hypothetical protein